MSNLWDTKRWGRVAFFLGLAVAGLCLLWDAPDSSELLQAQEKPATRQTEKKPEPILRRFMQRKLGATNLVLEGLVTENYELISKGAAELQDISSAEKWRISNDVMYRQQSAEFQRKVGQLKKMAEAKNLDGAALAYFDSTMSCVECHKWVRAVLVAD